MADIFGKFYNDASKTVKKVRTKSEIFAESVKIKNQIKSIEEERNVLFQELGRMTHISLQNNTLSDDRLAELKEKSNEIKGKEGKIAELKQMLSDLELKEASKIKGKNATGKCPGCGAIVYEGYKFCEVCGYDIQGSDGADSTKDKS
ncbi:MAG TPA: hypothetical protein PLP57_06535 [Candidatus Saccharicenans sp.]|nr:hypothetical protein [Candidatus Saccharicenans sp.]HRD02282.1 hypothetical protein [Candidatus Saccharicenans sp.]